MIKLLSEVAMEYYKIRLKPKSSFGTLPMSDTIFGQMVWTLRRMGFDVDKMLENYLEEPFLVVSDFLLDDCGIVPKIPARYSVGKSKEDKLDMLLNRKSLKQKGYIPISTIIKEPTLTREKIVDKSRSIGNQHYQTSDVVRCSTNRLTSTTGDGFSPYTVIEHFYNGIDFSFYFFCSDDLKEYVLKALEIIGEIGFGKDASVGKGKFDVIVGSCEKVSVEKERANAVYTLSNCYLQGIDARNAYYEPFTRFGKHGDILAITGNPFKNPVVMARQGALIVFGEQLPSKCYIGKGIKSLSFHQETVMQGYSLYIPVYLEEDL